MRSQFSRTFLFMLAGPIIWAAHFLFIYSLHGLVCARPALQVDWAHIPASAWVIVASSVLALAAMTLIYMRWHSSMPRLGTPKFLPWLAATLSMLSALAIVWETIPLLWLPAC